MVVEEMAVRPWLYFHVYVASAYILSMFLVPTYGYTLSIGLLLAKFGGQNRDNASERCSALDQDRCSCRKRPPLQHVTLEQSKAQCTL